MHFTSLENLTRLASRLAAASVGLFARGEGKREIFACSSDEKSAGIDRNQLRAFCEMVAEQELPLLVSNAAAPPDSETVSGEVVRAFIAFPLVVEGKTRGVLCAVDSKPREWTREEIEAIEDFASLAANDLHLRREKARHTAREKSQTTVKERLKEELTLIEDVAHSLGSSTDLAGAFVDILDKLCSFTGWERGEAWTAGRGSLQFLASWTRPDVDTRFLPTISRTSGSEGEAIFELAKNGSQLLAENVDADRKGSIAVFALLNGEDCIGAIAFYSSRKIPLAEQQRAVLTAAASQIGPILGRRLTEESLRESEARYRHFIETAQEGVWAFDADDQTDYVNRRMANILGYKVEAMAGKSILDFVHPESHAALQSQFDRCHKGARESKEHRFLTSEGGDCWALVATSSIVDSTGHFSGVLALVTDISNRKHAETQLRIRERQLSQAQEVARIGSWDWDLETGLITASDGLFRILGIEREEPFTYEAFLTHVAPADASRLKSELLEAVEKQSPLNTEYSIVTSIGTVRTISARGDFYYDNMGMRGHMAGVVKDVTREKKAEKDLRRAARVGELFGAVLAASTEYAIIGVDSSGLIHTFNPGAERLLGYTAAEAVGKISAEAFHDAEEIISRAHELSIDAGFEVLVANVRDGASETRDWTYIRKDRSRVTVSLTVTEMRDSRGDTTGYIGIAVDITDRLAAEKASVAAREAAEQGARAKSEFLANMSHEIRTPINGITGMTELLLDTDLSEEQREYLELVQVSAKSLIGIIDDILVFSRIDAGKLALENQPFELRQSIHETMRTLEFRARQKGLRLVHEVHADVPDRLVGDLGRVRQVMVNLLENAIKFTSAGQIRVDVTATDENADGVELRFVVADTGIGIPADRRTEIFEPFTQADASTTRRYGGSGLGLSISKQLVEMMGGRIWVESEVGKGSNFFFTARLQRDAAPKESARRKRTSRSMPAPTGRPLRVLLAEDNLINQRLAVSILEKHGHSTVLASTGAEALRLAQSEEFDAILMDVQMPDLSGLEATRMIRVIEERTGRHVPIIGVTAHVMPEDAQRCLESGMDAYCAKPVNASLLLAKLEEFAYGAKERAPHDEESVSAPAVSLTLHARRKNILDAVGGDEDLLVELSQIFLDDSREVLESLRQAIDLGDAQGTIQYAHKFRGSVATFDAEELARLALSIEQRAKEGEVSRTVELFDALMQSYNEFADVLSGVISVSKTA